MSRSLASSLFLCSSRQRLLFPSYLYNLIEANVVALVDTSTFPGDVPLNTVNITQFIQNAFLFRWELATDPAFFAIIAFIYQIQHLLSFDFIQISPFCPTENASLLVNSITSILVHFHPWNINAGCSVSEVSLNQYKALRDIIFPESNGVPRKTLALRLAPSICCRLCSGKSRNKWGNTAFYPLFTKWFAIKSGFASLRNQLQPFCWLDIRY